MRALMIRHPHIDRILEGKKTWEIRRQKTLIRETIGLIASGSGTIIGVCELKDCKGPLTQEQFYENAKKAGILPNQAQLGNWRLYAWVVKEPRILNRPV